MNEYLRPWKLASLAAGIALLVAGRYHYRAPDWDVPISFIMASITYFFAPWTLRVLLERRWALWPLAALATWFAVDGSYSLYWYFVDPVALEMMRGANFLASLALYFVCGLLWLYQGSLRQFARDVTLTFSFNARP